MKPSVLIGGVLLAGIIFAFWLGGPDLPSPAKETVKENTVPDRKTGSSHSIATTEASRLPRESQTPPSQTQLTEKDGILAAIETASVSYDPISLPKIQPYLTHPDPEVRAEALNGIVNLGDAAGAALLREAAERVPSKQEAVRLIEMAEYLELPVSTTKFLKPQSVVPKAKP